MANPEHARPDLKQGVEFWNRWRADNPECAYLFCASRADWSSADLGSLTLMVQTLKAPCLVIGVSYRRRSSRGGLRDSDLKGADTQSTDFDWMPSAPANLGCKHELENVSNDARSLKGQQPRLGLI